MQRDVRHLKENKDYDLNKKKQEIKITIWTKKTRNKDYHLNKKQEIKIMIGTERSLRKHVATRIFGSKNSFEHFSASTWTWTLMTSLKKLRPTLKIQRIKSSKHFFETFLKILFTFKTILILFSFSILSFCIRAYSFIDLLYTSFEF